MALSLKGILGAVAPILASALPGPLGGMAKKIVAEALGNPEASDKEIEKLLATANPETLLKLKQAEADFEIKLQELDIDLERLSVEDRANARAREVSLKDKTPRVLAGLVIGGYLGLQFYVVSTAIPALNRDIVLGSLEILKMAVVLVLGYYFGSSAGSARKTELAGK